MSDGVIVHLAGRPDLAGAPGPVRDLFPGTRAAGIFYAPAPPPP